VRTLFTVAGNPVLSTPDGSALERALTGLDFYAAVDIYVNETTRHADVILPPTSALERDHYDLVFHHFAVRNTARFTPAVFAKGKDQRHDWQIFKAIGLRTVRRLDRKPPLKRRIMLEARLRPSPTFLIANLLRFGRSKALMSDLRKSPAGVDLGPLQAGQLPGRLLTRNKRVDAAPSFVLDDLARLRDQAAPADGELLLIGRRHQQDCNSWMHNSQRLTKGRDRHQLLINPADLAARGLTSGDTVTVTSRVGEVKVEALATDDMMPGVVSLPHGYGHQRDGVRLGHATQVVGVSINDLTDSARVDISGNAAFTGLPVTIA
jgi:anaerobic selenocysteine-containing dehydrogenase